MLLMLFYRCEYRCPPFIQATQEVLWSLRIDRKAKVLFQWSLALRVKLVYTLWEGFGCFEVLWTLSNLAWKCPDWISGVKVVRCKATFQSDLIFFWWFRLEGVHCIPPSWWVCILFHRPPQRKRYRVFTLVLASILKLDPNRVDIMIPTLWQGCSEMYIGISESLMLFMTVCLL